MNEVRDGVRPNANESATVNESATAPKCVLGVCVIANGSMLSSGECPVWITPAVVKRNALRYRFEPYLEYENEMAAGAAQAALDAPG